MSAEENMKLMQTLDDAWNAQDLETFAQRHKEDVVVRWTGQPATHGIHDHRLEAIQFFKTFPDQHLDNRPYKVFFASGDWTCSIARFTGHMRGSMQGPDGKEIPPTGKAFEVDFCTVARWDKGQIVEENLFYDLVGMMRQLGLSKWCESRSANRDARNGLTTLGETVECAPEGTRVVAVRRIRPPISYQSAEWLTARPVRRSCHMPDEPKARTFPIKSKT